MALIPYDIYQHASFRQVESIVHHDCRRKRLPPQLVGVRDTSARKIMSVVLSSGHAVDQEYGSVEPAVPAGPEAET